MALKRTDRIRTTHSLPIIGHPNQGEASILHLDGDGTTPRIDTVFEKLFHDCSGTLNNLAGCNATNHVFR
jgi:hypothetical protein